MTSHRATGQRLYCAGLACVVVVVDHDDEGRVVVEDSMGLEWNRAAWQLDDFPDALQRAYRAVAAIAADLDDQRLIDLAAGLAHSVDHLRKEETAQ